MKSIGHTIIYNNRCVNTAHSRYRISNDRTRGRDFIRLQLCRIYTCVLLTGYNYNWHEHLFRGSSSMSPLPFWSFGRKRIKIQRTYSVSVFHDNVVTVCGGHSIEPTATASGMFSLYSSQIQAFAKLRHIAYAMIRNKGYLLSIILRQHIGNGFFHQLELFYQISRVFFLRMCELVYVAYLFKSVACQIRQFFPVDRGNGRQGSCRYIYLIQEDPINFMFIYDLCNKRNPVYTKTINPIVDIYVVTMMQESLDCLKSVTPCLKTGQRSITLLEHINQSIRRLVNHFRQAIFLEIFIYPVISILRMNIRQCQIVV